MERFIETVRVLRAAGAPDADALIEYACRELGYIPVRVANVPRNVSIFDVASPLKENGDYFHAVAERLADRNATPDDARVCGKELDELIAVLVAQREGLRSIENAADEEVVRERIGPRRSGPRFLRLRRASA